MGLRGGRQKAEYILWIGPVVDEPTLLAGRAISPAANRWQAGLIQGLEQLGRPVYVLGHVPEPAWPRGPLRTSARSPRLAEGVVGGFVAPWNLPLVRSISGASAYAKALLGVVLRKGRPRVVITYNYGFHAVWVGTVGQRILDVPWVCVVADGDGVKTESRRGRMPFDRADGRVFLSWREFELCPTRPKLHLDGAVSTIPAREGETAPKEQPPVVLYTGAINDWGGVPLLIDAFQRVNHPHAELWLCGKGRHESLERAVRANPRVRFFGFVTEQELERLERRAAIFVNPRRPSLKGNRVNFPSKILVYLSYGKPVISTWTAGLAPEYHELLVVVEEDPQDMARAIDRVLDWDDQQQRECREKALDFLSGTRTWSRQAYRLLDWIRTEVSVYGEGR